MQHENGAAFLVYYHNLGVRICYPVVMKDISMSPNFLNRLEKNKYFDLESPYGYSGPLVNGVITREVENDFIECLFMYCSKEGIITQFIRFHPLLGNENILPVLFEKRYLKNIIYVDTTSIEIIDMNIDSKNRNMIRKAIKGGVTVVQKHISDYNDFFNLYNETMKRNNAEEYYFFNKKYFDSLIKLENNVCIFYAYLNEVPISGAIIFYNNDYAHYHLSGSNLVARELAAGNLLLYEVSCWASKTNIKKFLLGGGLNAEDNLFKFKKQFNKNGIKPFYIGRTIFDQEKYDMLLTTRFEDDSSFNANNEYLIQYRR